MRESTFARSLVLVLSSRISFTVATVAAASVATVFVTNSNNSGPGSFRDAINQANGNPAMAPHASNA